MDFLKGLVAGMNDKDDGDEKITNEVFDEAVKVAAEISAKIIKRSKHWSDKKDFFNASLFLFVVGWALVGHMYGGVEHAEQKNGDKHNPVSRLWHLLRIAFASGNIDRTMMKLMTFDKDFEEGKFDEVH